MTANATNERMQPLRKTAAEPGTITTPSEAIAEIDGLWRELERLRRRPRTAASVA